MGDINPAIEKLRASAARLNRITDQVNTTFRTAEEFLNEACSIGLTVYVKVKDVFEEEDPRESQTQYLAYRRVGSKYRIAVVWSCDFRPNSETVKPWSESTREEKLDSVAKLPELISEVAKKIDDRIEAAEESGRLANTILKSLSAQEGK